MKKHKKKRKAAREELFRMDAEPIECRLLAHAGMLNEAAIGSGLPKEALHLMAAIVLAANAGVIARSLEALAARDR